LVPVVLGCQVTQTVRPVLVLLSGRWRQRQAVVPVAGTQPTVAVAVRVAVRVVAPFIQVVPQLPDKATTVETQLLGGAVVAAAVKAL
jgi:hypothetical protein